MSTSPALWSIILAGGDGKRVLPLTQSWLGVQKPKQYCTFVGSRSLLQHTVARASRLCEKEHVVTVIDRSHRQYASAQLGHGLSRVIVQPANRETAPGIYLPLTYIRSWCRQATVVIYPSDHFVYPEDQFLAGVSLAIELSRRHRDRLLLLAAKPDRVEVEYGWMQPGSCLDGKDGRLRAVRSFIEKPAYEEARAAFAAGALWNTFLMVATVERLWELGWLFFPEIMVFFERLESALGTVDEQQVLESIYSSMPVCSFSSGLLQHAAEHAAVMELEGILWSDWGNPERILTSLYRINKRPAFPMELAIAGRRKAAGATRRTAGA
jgi:mannose-1-phosphate guanylyltransferase